MAFTPNFGLPYPACPDCQPCPDCPGGLDAFENLARATDTALSGLSATDSALAARVTVLETHGGILIARGRRTTNSSATTGAAVGVMRLPGVTVLAGRGYWVCTNSLLIDGTTTTDVVRAELRITTDGSVPTTASPVLAFAQDQIGNAAQGPGLVVLGYHAPGASDQTLSVLLDITLTAGTGSTIVVGGGAGAVAEIFILDAGVDPGNSGINL
jgi:hypothetical protein